LLGYSGLGLAVQNAVFVGLLVTILALWVLGTDDEYGGWFHRMSG
jgi:hypothetical protein